ncbi:MAG: OmpH family outer membrane protein [Roseobacter sp.]
MAPVVWAQPLLRTQIESPILTIDSESLFEESAFGQSVIATLEARGAALAAENRAIEAELATEEKELTDLRPTITPEEFRPLADAFDAKVQQTRQAQDTKTRELNAALENQRVVFLNAAIPVLEQIMREANAAVVLERRSIFISSSVVDITRLAIDRLNASLGDPDFSQGSE